MQHRTDSTRKGSAARRILATIAALVVATFALAPVPAAYAAGDGVLNVTLTPIDVADNSTITDIQDGTHSNRVTYQVQYSCTTAACDDTQLQFSPSQSDPNGLLPAGRYLLTWDSWVAPAGATIGGTDATGKQVTLGNLAAGQSGTFTLTYTVSSDRHRDVPFGSFYPNGFPIEMAATISSETAVAPIVGAASPVIWHIAAPAGPTANIAAPGSVNTDTPVGYNLTMSGGNLYYGPGANVTGDAALSAVGSYRVVYHAPPEAVIVSAEYGGVVDPVARTVTWTSGTPGSPVYGARGGWGLNLVSGFNGQGAGPDNVPGDDNFALWRYRAVVLEFPGANFPAADANGCNFSTDVTSSLDVSVTYLDGASTTRTTSVSRTNQVACWDPFGGTASSKDVSGGYANQFAAGDGNMGGGVFAANVPAPGEADRSLQWRVVVTNRGNVPAVAVIDEPNLSQPDLPVYRITPVGVGATVDWVRSDGATGTTVLSSGQSLTAPAGMSYTSARVTTADIAPGRVQPTDTDETMVYVLYDFRVSSTAPIGEERTNTAHVSLTYPGYESDIPGLPLENDVSRTVRFATTSPVIGAAFTAAPVVDGGGPLVAGTGVTFAMRGATDEIWPGTQIIPQLAFIAPAGWAVISGSAEIAAGAPAGVTFTYTTTTIGGVSRDVVIATWPSAISPSTTGVENWPTLTVRATPTAAASSAPGAAVALVRAGDASGTLSDAISPAYITNPNQFRASPGAVVDSGDIDGDGNTTEEFAQASAAALTVAAPSAIQVFKELCIPDAAAVDGCAWVADATQTHYVPVTADDITYRITVANSSAGALSGVVAYDVLPHVGDTGLLPGSTPRGSQFDLTIASVESVSPGITMAYSASTNPTRPEVYPGAPGAVDDWNADPVDKQALRMTVGALAAGASAQVVFTAAVTGTPVADDRACNTVAVDATQTLPTEPLAVCVTLAEADLSVQLSTFDNLQAGRPSTLAFTVTNLGGSAAAPASVAIEIPDGLSVTDLTIDRWLCTVAGGGAAPVGGQATLNCAPVDTLGQPRALLRDEVESLSFPVVVDATSGELCVSAVVTGTLFDPVMLNNTTGGCDQVAPPPAGLVITKDDGQTATKIGAEYIYTITVTNTLLAETVNDGVVTDTLPASLEVVSADGGANVAGQTVTWSLAALAPLASVELHVTVRVLDTAVSPLVNTATVAAPDPGFAGETLSDSDDDSNVVRSLSVTKSSDATTPVSAGGVVTFTVTVTNDGPGDYTTGDPATVLDDLSDVLDDAAYRSDVASSLGDAPIIAGDELSWSGALAAGESAEITYSVRLSGSGDRHVANVACVPDDEVSSGADPCAAVTFNVTVSTRVLGSTGLEISLGATGAGVLAVALGAVLLILRRRRIHP